MDDIKTKIEKYIQDQEYAKAHLSYPVPVGEDIQKGEGCNH